MTHKDAILELLKDAGDYGLTPMTALHRVGTFRLAARISELRDDGYRITTVRHKLVTGSTVARYVLTHPEPFPAL